MVTNLTCCWAWRSSLSAVLCAVRAAGVESRRKSRSSVVYMSLQQVRSIAMPSLQVERLAVCEPLSATVVGVAKIGYGMRAGCGGPVTKQRHLT